MFLYIYLKNQIYGAIFTVSLLVMKIRFSLLFFLFGILITTAQENWNFLPVDLPASRNGHIIALDDNIVYVIVDNGLFYKTTDGGNNWDHSDSEVRNSFYDMAFYNSNIGYAVGDQGSVIKTVDAGSEWISLDTGTDLILKSVAINSLNSIWAVGHDGIIIHSEDGGESWAENNSLTDKDLHAIRFKSENEGYIAGKDGVLFYTNDAGTTWENMNPGTNNDLFGILFIENTTILLGGEIMEYSPGYFDVMGEYIYQSEDGTNFTEIHIGIYMPYWSHLTFVNLDIAFSVGSFDALCECCFIHIDKSTNGGLLWENNYTKRIENSEGSCNAGYARMTFPSPDTGYILLGSKILKTPYTSTAGIDNRENLKSFTIYPNPVTEGKFRINYNNSTETGIRITDILGKQIHYENLKTQNHEIDLSRFSGGIYFVDLLQNGNPVGSHKLILQ